LLLMRVSGVMKDFVREIRIDVLSKTFAKGNLGFCERERFRHGGLQTQWDIWSCLTCFTNWALIDTSWEL